MMNRNMTSLVRDRQSARPVFRSFLDGIVLLAVTALLLTAQISPVDDPAVATTGDDTRPVQASLFPSIVSAADPAPKAEPRVEATPSTACSRVDERQVRMEVLQHDAETLVIVVRRGEGSTSRIIPTVVRPEV